MNPFQTLADLFFDARYSRAVQAMAAGAAVVDAARVVASLAPADAVQDYVHACTRGTRTYNRWRTGITAVSGCIPGFMWAAGIALGMSSG